MSLTVLLDLDDTLLGNVTDDFIPHYMTALADYFDFAPGIKVSRILSHAVYAMTISKSPAKTLADAFDAVFYPGIGVKKQDVVSFVNRFYSEEYPKLRRYVKVKPAAKKLIDGLFDHGYDVVIATNPLFPRTATLQRLLWAGLPLEEYPFKLVSTYEDFHFSKPNPAYYAEVLAQLGWMEQPVVMVGNSFENDIVPCQALGISSFHIVDDDNPQTKNAASIDHGELTDALDWIKKQSEISYQPWHSLDVDINTLLTTPAAVQTLTKLLPETAWHKSVSPDEWSLAGIVGHLLESDIKVNLDRIQQVVIEDNPFINKIHSDEKMEIEQAKHNPFRLLDAFIDVRMNLLSIINTLRPADWKRSARHSIFGPTNLQELVDFSATHDRVHIRQIKKTIEENAL